VTNGVHEDIDLPSAGRLSLIGGLAAGVVNTVRPKEKK